MPYLTAADKSVSEEVSWCEFSAIDAKRMAVSCSVAGFDVRPDEEGRRFEGHERVECVSRFM